MAKLYLRVQLFVNSSIQIKDAYIFYFLFDES